VKEPNWKLIHSIGAIMAVFAFSSGCHLFRKDPWEPADWDGKPNLPAEAVRDTSMRYVRFDLDAIQSRAAEQFEFPTPDGSTVTLVKKNERRTVTGGYIWRGEVKGDEKSIATLSVLKGMLVGDVLMSNGTLYRVDQVADGIQVVFEIDQAAFPAEAEPLGVTKPVGVPRGRLQAVAYSGSLQGVQFCDSDQIDVLVAYTDAACAGYFIGRNSNACSDVDRAKLLVELQKLDEVTNGIFDKSLAKPRVSIVRIASAEGYVEQDTIRQDLELLMVRDLTAAEIAAGQVAPLQSVHDMRAQYRADVVSLITRSTHKYPTTQRCGKSTLMTAEDSSFEEYAFTVVPVNCLGGSFSFTHELGHVMGADHDSHSLASNIPNNLAFVKANPSGNADPWRTVMAENNAECADTPKKSCTRLPYFSNPSPALNHGGDPMGSTNRNNSGVVSSTVDTVSQYRVSSSCDNT
jgi:Metallo-peptidase family M12B Reprolysin-like